MIIQTPWFERKFDFSFPVGLFPVIIERLRGTQFRIEAMIKDIPEVQLIIKKDGKWSAKEIIGHLYDLEELWTARVDDFIAKKEVLRAADLANTRTTEAGHNNRSANELLLHFAEARSKLIKKVENMDEAAVALSSLHPRLKTPMRLIDNLFFVAEHDDHELTKMRGLLK